MLLSDFGISHDYETLGDTSDVMRSTTTGPTAKTLRYCAPEVYRHESRNITSDIWSLGCVFLEMVSALKRKSAEDILRFLGKNGERKSNYHENLSGTA